MWWRTFCLLFWIATTMVAAWAHLSLPEAVVATAVVPAAGVAVAGWMRHATEETFIPLIWAPVALQWALREGPQQPAAIAMAVLLALAAYLLNMVQQEIAEGGGRMTLLLFSIVACAVVQVYAGFLAGEGDMLAGVMFFTLASAGAVSTMVLTLANNMPEQLGTIAPLLLVLAAIATMAASHTAWRVGKLAHHLRR